MTSSKLIVLLIVASTFFIFMTNGIYALTFAPFATSILGLSPGLVGAIIGMSGFIRIFLDLPLGVTLDRVGRRIPGLIGTLFFAGSAAIGAIATNVIHLIVFQLFQGLSHMFFMSANAVLIADLAPDGQTGRYMSVWQIGINLGGAIGPILAGMILSTSGYRTVLWLSAGISLIPVAFYSVIVWRCRAPRPQRTGAVRRVPLRLVLNDRRIFGGCFAAFASFFVLTGIRATVLPLYSTEILGFDAEAVGQVIGVTSLINSFLLLPSGLLTDKVTSRTMLMGGLALFIVSLGGFVFWTTYPLLVLAASILGGASAMVGPARMVAITEYAPRDAKGTAMGLYRTFQSLAFLFGPLVSGVLYESSSLAPFIASIVICCAAIGIIFTVLSSRTTDSLGENPTR
jgi:MFS family permease